MMKIFGLEIAPYTHQALFEEIDETLKNPSSTPKALFTPNPEICLQALSDGEFRNNLQQADILTNDGIGLYVGYQILDFLEGSGGKSSSLKRAIATLLLPYFIGNILVRKQTLYKKYGDRICGSDLTSELVELAETNNIKIAIIDRYNPDDSAKVAAQKVFSQKLSEVFPSLRFDFYVFNPEEADEIFDQIAHSDAKILFSTLGMKLQEQSILQGLEKCPNIRLGLGVGSSFDYFTGFQKRAPESFRRSGLEWLYRIFTSPNKLARLKRIYEATIVFPIKIIFYS